MPASARAALVEHLSIMSAFNTVRAYAGELARAKKDPRILTGIMPAALVLHAESTRTSRVRRHEFHVLVGARVQALDEGAAEAEAIALAEEVETFLLAQPYWTHEDQSFYLPEGHVIAITHLATNAAFALYLVAVECEQMV
jgi:hypothetical protein